MSDADLARALEATGGNVRAAARWFKARGIKVAESTLRNRLRGG